MTTRTTRRKAPEPARVVEVVEEEVEEYELPEDDEVVEAGPIQGLDLLDDLEDDPAPTASDVAARPRSRSVPDGDYLAEVERLRISLMNGEHQLSVGMRARGKIVDNGVEDTYVGALLPWLNVILTPKLSDKGNRRDFHLWNFVEAVLGKERKDEVLGHGLSYREAVATLINEIQEMMTDSDDEVVIVAVKKVTRPNGKDPSSPYHNIDRVYAVPDGLEPIFPFEDA